MFSWVKCLISTGLRVVREYGSKTGSYQHAPLTDELIAKYFTFWKVNIFYNQEKYLRFSVHVRAIHKEASTSVIRGCNLIIILRNSVLEIRSGEFNGEKETSVSVILAIKWLFMYKFYHRGAKEADLNRLIFGSSRVEKYF